MAEGPAESGRAADEPERQPAAAAAGTVTLATVLSRLAGEVADLRAAHAAERERADRLDRERAAALDELAGTRAAKAAVEAALAEAGRREAALRQDLETGRARLDDARRGRAALLLGVERLFQTLEHRPGNTLVVPLPGRDVLPPPSLPVADEAPPIVAVATGLGRRGARRVAAAVARQAEAAGARAVLLTDEAVPAAEEPAAARLTVVRLPRPRALPPAERDTYLAGRLRLLIEIWEPASVVPFGPDAARLLALADLDQAATAEGSRAARS